MLHLHSSGGRVYLDFPVLPRTYPGERGTTRLICPQYLLSQQVSVNLHSTLLRPPSSPHKLLHLRHSQQTLGDKDSR